MSRGSCKRKESEKAMPRESIAADVSRISAELGNSSLNHAAIARHALNILYCCLTRLKLQQQEIEKGIHEIEFLVEMGGGGHATSITNEIMFGRKAGPGKSGGIPAP